MTQPATPAFTLQQSHLPVIQIRDFSHWLPKLTDHRDTQGAFTNTAPGSPDAFDHQPRWATIKLTNNRDGEKTETWSQEGEGGGGASLNRSLLTSVSENIPSLYALPLDICFMYHLMLPLQQPLAYSSLVTFRTTASCQLSLWIHPRSSKLLSVQKGSQMFRTLLSYGSSFQRLFKILYSFWAKTLYLPSSHLHPPISNPVLWQSSFLHCTFVGYFWVTRDYIPKIPLLIIFCNSRHISQKNNVRFLDPPVKFFLTYTLTHTLLSLVAPHLTDD